MTPLEKLDDRYSEEKEKLARKELAKEYRKKLRSVEAYVRASSSLTRLSDRIRKGQALEPEMDHVYDTGQEESVLKKRAKYQEDPDPETDWRTSKERQEQDLQRKENLRKLAKDNGIRLDNMDWRTAAKTVGKGSLTAGKWYLKIGLLYMVSPAAALAYTTVKVIKGVRAKKKEREDFLNGKDLAADKKVSRTAGAKDTAAGKVNPARKTAGKSKGDAR